MSYTYADIPDKTEAGMETELKKGFVKIAAFFQQSMGVPLEVFNDMVREKLKTRADQWHFYLKARNDKPDIFA